MYIPRFDFSYLDSHLLMFISRVEQSIKGTPIIYSKFGKDEITSPVTSNIPV